MGQIITAAAATTIVSIAPYLKTSEKLQWIKPKAFSYIALMRM